MQAARSVLPTLDEQAVTEQLSITSQTLSTDLSELRGALSRAKPVCQGEGLGAAAQLIADLQNELNEFERAIDAHTLRPLPGDTPEFGAEQLTSSSKSINQNVSQLISAAAQGNEIYTDKAARDTAQSLKQLAGAVRTVAATTNNPDIQRKIIYSGQDVLLHSAKLINETEKSLQTVGITDGLQDAAKSISQALNGTIGCLPGQKDVDSAITNIIEWSSIIDSGRYPATNKSYGELQQELNTAAANLNEASSVVVVSVRSPTQLASSSKDFSLAFHDLLDVSMEMAGQTKDSAIRNEMVHSLKSVSTSSSSLLTTSKALSADPMLPNGKNQLTAAARAVTDTINHLVNVCTSAAPGQNECDNAIRKIQAMKHHLENPSEPINDASYYEALDSVIEKSKILGEGMTGITTSAKSSLHEQFAEHIKSISGAICHLVEAAAQTAYLVSSVLRS